MDLMKLLKTRRSYRRFRQRKVDSRIIDEMFLAVTYASSAANRQPLSYIVVQDEEKLKAIFPLIHWARYLPPELGTPKEGEEPVLFVAVVQNMDISKECDVDVGLAISNMTLVAWQHGVGSCIIGAFDRVRLTEMLPLAANQVLHTMVAFGYPSHKSRLVEVKEGNIKYNLDENRDYIVPKRSREDIVRYL